MEQFYFVITERCNLACSHCIRDSSPWRDEAAEATMIQDAIGQIASAYPNSLVLLSGGEPTIHRSFREILDFALHSGLDINLNTNGVTGFFMDRHLRTIAHRDRLSVQVSLDGDEATHDRIRGVGSFRRALRTLHRLREHGITCCVSTTVIDSAFLERAEAFVAALDDLGLAHIAIKRATYAGRASGGDRVDTAGWNHHVYRLRGMPWKTRLKIAPMYDFASLDRLSDQAIADLTLPPSAVNCGAGTAKVYVYGNGDVCPCTCFKDRPMGNLYKAPLAEILGNRPEFRVDHPACTACRYARLCQGGCLGSGYQASGVLGAPDPRCPRVAGTPGQRQSIIRIESARGPVESILAEPPGHAMR